MPGKHLTFCARGVGTGCPPHTVRLASEPVRPGRIEGADHASNPSRRSGQRSKTNSIGCLPHKFEFPEFFSVHQDYSSIGYRQEIGFPQLFDNAYQLPVDHRLHQREDVCFKHCPLHIVFVDHRVTNLGNSFAFREQSPRSRTHRVKAKISATGEVENHLFVAHLARHHLWRNSYFA